MPGKLPLKLLEKYVFGRTGVRDKSVLIGPAVGEDAAIIDLGGKYLVVHSDPITEATHRVGWLAVHIASNDIAVRGARPRWITAVLLLPEGFDEAMLDGITRDMDEAARRLGAMIVGGHTEEAPRLDRPIVTCTVIGLAERYVSSSGARPGDKVLLVGEAGIEGTAILATDFREMLLELGIDPGIVDKASMLYGMVSVVEPALRLAGIGASAMHDPTEGGVVGGLVEIAMASGVEIEAWEDRIPLLSETRIISGKLGIDPLRLVSSGALVATMPEENLGILRETGLKYSVVGVVKHRGRPRLVLHRVSGRTEEYHEPPQDELARLWEQYREVKS